MLAVVLGVLGWSALAVAALRAPEVRVEQAAALSLADDDGGKPMFTAGNLAPGEAVERCIKVRIDRGSPDQVALATRASGTGLERLELTIDAGQSGTFADCSDFRGRNVFAGTLADLVQQYPRGLGLESWSPERDESKTRTYRIRARMSEDATQGELAASATFLWRASAEEQAATSPDERPPDTEQADDGRAEQRPGGAPAPTT
ncbi:MAG: hypothetical protein M3P40_06930, partial [Actinomycetota bacterium]|nr:hypothetical protein [Actinomycetota bacterium]